MVRRMVFIGSSRRLAWGRVAAGTFVANGGDFNPEAIASAAGWRAPFRPGAMERAFCPAPRYSPPRITSGERHASRQGRAMSRVLVLGQVNEAGLALLRARPGLALDLVPAATEAELIGRMADV